MQVWKELVLDQVQAGPTYRGLALADSLVELLCAVARYNIELAGRPVCSCSLLLVHAYPLFALFCRCQGRQQLQP